MLIDIRLTDEPSASSRLFRIYRPAPAHYHKTCDEYLQVIQGRGKFVVDGGDPIELGPGQLFFSAVTRCTPFPKSSKARWSSSLSIRRAAIPQTSPSSTPRLALPRISSKPSRSKQAQFCIAF